MLIIPENTKEHFRMVQKWAYENKLEEEFQNAIARLHLYGCDWTNQDNCKVTLYSDFAPNSFAYTIDFRDKNNPETYNHFLSGGLIYHKSDRNWSMHS